RTPAVGISTASTNTSTRMAPPARLDTGRCALCQNRGMKRAIFLLLLAAAPALAQTSPAPPPGIELAYTQFTLANGLRVILREDHTVRMVTVNMWYHVGSAREKEKRTGFAHLFEHLMFMGSGHVKPGEFDEWLEAAGGDNNGSTENDRTN